MSGRRCIKPRYIDVNQLAWHLNYIYDLLDCGCTVNVSTITDTPSTVITGSDDRDLLVVNEDRTLSIEDAKMMVFLNGGTNSVNLTIDPATVLKKRIPIYGFNDNFELRITTASGVIKMFNSIDQPYVQIVAGESVVVYTDGTNLYLIK